MGWGETRQPPKRRSEIDVAADALAAIYCSGLIKPGAETVRALAKHCGIDPADAIRALDRHLGARARPPRDVAVDPRPPRLVPIGSPARGVDRRPQSTRPTPAAVDNGRTGKGARYSEETKARVAARAHEIGIGPAAKESGVSWPTVRGWSEARPPAKGAPGYESWPHPKRVTA